MIIKKEKAFKKLAEKLDVPLKNVKEIYELGFEDGYKSGYPAGEEDALEANETPNS